MKILHVQETLSPRAGGPANVLPSLAQAQSDAGHDVVIATTNVDHPRGVYRKPGWDTLPNGVPVLYAPVQFVPLRASFGLTSYLMRAIPACDIVHVHGLYRFPVTVAAYMSRKLGVPFIIRPHGSLDPFLHHRSTSGQLRLKRAYERWFDLPNLNAAAAVHYTAEWERDRASFLQLRSPSFIIPNGLHWEEYATLPQRGEMRARWGLGQEPIVLFLGRLHPQKGLDILVPAFQSVLKRRPDARLVIAGPERDKYGDTVRGWVTAHGLDRATLFVGPLFGEDLQKAYVDADVFALSSRTENFGMTVIESLACGLPVVISDQVGIHAEVSRAGAGLVTRCSSDEVAAALLALLADQNRRQKMGESGRQLVYQSFSWPAIVNALTIEYEAVIDRQRSRKALDGLPSARQWRSPWFK